MRTICRRPAAATLTLLVTLAAATAPAATMHFRLERSAPAAGETVAAVEEVRLWFSEPPQDGSTSIRLVDASGGLVEGSVSADPEDARQQVLTLETPAPDGEYRVVWRAMAADGHVVRDELTFTVAR